MYLLQKAMKSFLLMETMEGQNYASQEHKDRGI